jgi:hypothetical protein
LRARIGSSSRSDLASARSIDDDESCAADRSASWNRSRHDPVRSGREQVASDAGAEPKAIDASMAPHPETPDAAAVGRYLAEDELDRRRPAQDEEERRSPLSLRSAVGNPVTGET